VKNQLWASYINCEPG